MDSWNRSCWYSYTNSSRKEARKKWIKQKRTLKRKISGGMLEMDR